MREETLTSHQLLGPLNLLDMASELRVDRIIPVNGVPTGGGGGIVQIVEGSTSTEVIVSALTYTDTTLSATITPTSTSSKILVTVYQQFQIGASNNAGMGIRILRDSTVIDTPLDNGTGPLSKYVNNTGSTVNHFDIQSLQILDSPNTTSAITYKTQGRPYQTGGTVTYQYDSTDNGISRIILMEVSG